MIFTINIYSLSFFCQWSELKLCQPERHPDYGRYFDLCAHDSADVWANPKIFCLDEQTGDPALMAGTPPDYFSTGQLWGSPVYDWAQLHSRTSSGGCSASSPCLIMRLDSLLPGFQAYWAVKQGETTAINGKWLKLLGKLFFGINEKLSRLTNLAEDLGEITPEVEALQIGLNFQV